MAAQDRDSEQLLVRAGHPPARPSIFSPTSAVPGLMSTYSPCFWRTDLKGWHYIFLDRTHSRREAQTLRQLESQVA